MNILKSMFSAFLMYSRLPAPHVEWDEKNRRYSLCFFPLIGAVIGLLIFLWSIVCLRFNVGTVLFACIAAAIPVLVTGGIHVDGFCDVSDAEAACCDKKRRLEIMSDSHIGAFAVIKLAVYFIIQVGLFSELYGCKSFYMVCSAFVISRSLSGIAAVAFKCAKKSGSLQNFSKSADKKNTFCILLLLLILIYGSALFLKPIYGIMIILFSSLSFVYYRIFSYKKFGGITGDLEGYFLQICELAVMASCVCALKITEVF